MGKIKKKWLILPIELKKRTFDSKLLLTYYANKADFGIIFGDKKKINKKILLGQLPKGIYFDKDITLTNKRKSKFSKLGYECVVMDEEGLIYDNNDFYFNSRINKEEFKYIKYFFAWGKEQANILYDRIPSLKEKIKIVGNPRVDLLRSELRGIFEKDKQKIKQKYGSFILINSNFGMNNHSISSEYLYNKLKNSGAFLNKNQEEKFKIKVKYREDIFNEFLNSLIHLSKTFSNYNIIIRPHPGEDYSPWYEYANKYNNIEVVSEGGINSWIMAAEAVVHNNCTTGIESNLLDTPVISYMPYNSSDYDLNIIELPNKVSYKARSKKELINILNKILYEEHKFDFKRNTLNNYIANITGSFSVEEIISYLETIDINKDELNSKLIHEIRFDTEKLLKKYIKNIILKFPNLFQYFLDENKIKAWKNDDYLLKKKQPGIREKEIEERLKEISKYTIKNNFNIKKITSDVFAIY